jgi:hypothetical protein
MMSYVFSISHVGEVRMQDIKLRIKHAWPKLDFNMVNIFKSVFILSLGRLGYNLSVSLSKALSLLSVDTNHGSVERYCLDSCIVFQLEI